MRNWIARNGLGAAIVVAAALALLACGLMVASLGGCVSASGVTAEGDRWTYTRCLFDTKVESEKLTITKGNTSVMIDRRGYVSQVDPVVGQALDVTKAAIERVPKGL